MFTERVLFGAVSCIISLWFLIPCEEKFHLNAGLLNSGQHVSFVLVKR